LTSRDVSRVLDSARTGDRGGPYEDEPGTDLAAVAAGRIAVTPVHLDLTHHDGIGPLSASDLARLLAPAAEEVE
jgi:5'-nucleotidase